VTRLLIEIKKTRPMTAGRGVATSRSDHLVGAEDKRLRKRDTKRFCGLEI
jgi:hypothetical protein